jgi:hypothetical protein
MGINAGQNAGGLSRPLMIISIAILSGFALLLYHMYQLAPTQEEALWNRSMTLFGSVEAIAFTAAGYLFGKEVHREQAQKAEQRAEQRTTEAAAAKAAAAEANAKGQSLRHAIEAKQPVTPGTPIDESVRGQTGEMDARAHGHLSELATLAQSLFPITPLS